MICACIILCRDRDFGIFVLLKKELGILDVDCWRKSYPSINIWCWSNFYILLTYITLLLLHSWCCCSSMVSGRLMVMALNFFSSFFLPCARSNHHSWVNQDFEVTVLIRLITHWPLVSLKLTTGQPPCSDPCPSDPVVLLYIQAYCGT